MPWLSATAVVDHELVEPLSEALLQAGALSVDTSDADAGTAAERPLFDEPGSAREPHWSRARISARFPADADLSRALGVAFASAGAPASTAYQVSRVEDEDWVRITQSQFVPQRITSRLWIVPTWHAAPDPGAINIMLDPGLAFGTGTHPTTRLCLRWLDANVRGGESVIDFGCGSGILAIAALKLGAQSGCGVDIDPQALSAARENARRNHVEAIFVARAEGIDAAHVVVANILAQPLIVLAPLLARLTLDGGRLALSGILAHQAGEVCDVYSAWYEMKPVQQDEGWVLLSGIRRETR